MKNMNTKNMSRKNLVRVILAVAILYCFAPDLLAGPIDDTMVLLGSMVFSALNNREEDRDPSYVKMRGGAYGNEEYK